MSTEPRTEVFIDDGFQCERCYNREEEEEDQNEINEIKVIKGKM